MTALKARLRAAVYLVLRTGFRALPLSEGQRDRLRGRFLDRHSDWVPPPPRGRLDASGGDCARRPLVRADEPAIGHVPYRAEALPATLPATLVAFYLPQFHPIEQNDTWWGKGFTEWRNVTRALPQFEGHVQPRLPADLGFYDLRSPQVMRDQAALALEYGIGAFCFYYYWFSGTTLLETPLRQWLADDSIEMPFCLCWANENWARRWDGRGDDILIGQQHSAGDDIAFITHVADYLRDRRALKVDGKPMLLVYRPHLLPDARATAQRWRQWCRDHDIGEIHLAYVQGFERPDPRDIDFDAAVEFPPNMSNPRSLTADQFLINPEFHGDVRDWRELASEIAARPLPDYPMYPGVNPGWDNEARRSGRGRVYLHASPRGYRDWLSTTIHQRLAPIPPSHRLVFINAWNEWAEGAVLEPDLRLGHAYLDATRQALHAPAAARTATRPCVVIHAWYLEELGELLAQLKQSALDCRLIISTAHEHLDRVQTLLQASGLAGEVMAFANHGRDVLPFLHVANRLLEEGEDVVLKLHTKRSTHMQQGAQWRQELLLQLLDDGHGAQAVARFAQDRELGLLAPAGHLLSVRDYVGANDAALQRLQVRLGLHTDIRAAKFSAGSMFWVRLAALRPLLDAHLPPSAFDAEHGQVDGTLAHALERALGAVCVDAGYTVATIGATTEGAGYAYARRG
ncbi:glycoside hydrolase family 99-like domain-containing protein [Stenotrophomonas sp. ISL-67]|uniref:glycoside hydrolase family 99-like domain-containing protein n=1 Tax=Stenotrophomonas sp. ISL-67 TaxID=2819171 RepID=UPI001BE806FC|nr:glycoside hydrolase family 99-like domain-containing protein [Stenotrophomonas sp. ISL-67]MBT2768152.1 glycoside hydrolase family 99-like domain-containing protein [Stenotrophomonas sp. ISL-67]